MNGQPGWFLNKYYIKLKLGFQDCVNNEIVFLHILQENFDILDNHWLLLPMIE